MRNFFFVLTLMIMIGFVACSKKSNPGKTVAVEEVKVKSVTYTADVSSLIQAKCAPCHLPSKGGFKANFENYESAKKYGAEILDRIVKNPADRGFMPKMNPKLSDAEIAIFKKWVDQGLLEK